MQSLQLQANWPGRTFVFTRCSSGEKKTRNRRTKQERKTMVDSFIKKYQNLNSGKFPSLSLTHKKVGGSFYTVREIVREIIQENRVLGPGNLNSKSLNLQYFPEEQTGKYFPVDISDTVSISSINHTINHSQEDNYSSSNEYIITSLKINELDKAAKQERLDSNKNDMLVPQVPHGEQYYKDFSSGEYLNGKSPTVGNVEDNLSKQIDVANDKSNICVETYAEVQVSSLEAEICSFEQQTSSLRVSDEKSAVCKQMHTEDQISSSDDPEIHKLEQPAPSLKVAAGDFATCEHMSAEGQVISSETPESNLVDQSFPLSEVANRSGVFVEMHADVKVGCSDDHGTHEVEQSSPPFRAALLINPSLDEVVGDTDDSGDKSNEATKTFNSFPEANSISVSNSLPEVNISLYAVPSSSSDQLRNCFHRREYSSSAAIKTCNQDESQKEKDVEPMLFENESSTNESETAETLLSSVAVHEVSAENHSKPPLKNQDFSASESLEKPLFKSKDPENAISTIKITSEESLQYSVNGRPRIEARTESECTVTNNGSATTFRRNPSKWSTQGI